MQTGSIGEGRIGVNFLRVRAAGQCDFDLGDFDLLGMRNARKEKSRSLTDIRKKRGGVRDDSLELDDALNGMCGKARSEEADPSVSGSRQIQTDLPAEKERT